MLFLVLISFIDRVLHTIDKGYFKRVLAYLFNQGDGDKGFENNSMIMTGLNRG